MAGLPRLSKEDLDSVRGAAGQSFQQTQPKAVFAHDVELHKKYTASHCKLGQNRVEGVVLFISRSSWFPRRKCSPATAGEIPTRLGDLPA